MNKKTIKANYEEYIMMLLEYLKLYFKVITNGNNSKLKSILIEKIKEYKSIISLENKYLRYLDKYEKVINENEYRNVLEVLDELNGKTYTYYDNILEEVDIAFGLKREGNIISKRNFKTLVEEEELRDEIIGLTLTENDLYKYYSDVECIDYLKTKTKVLNVSVNDAICFSGCFTILDNDKLSDIKICVPKIYNLKSMLINIHEYHHGIMLYDYIGHEIPKLDFEELAVREEEIFVKSYVRNIKM